MFRDDFRDGRAVLFRHHFLIWVTHLSSVTKADCHHQKYGSKITGESSIEKAEASKKTELGARWLPRPLARLHSWRVAMH